MIKNKTIFITGTTSGLGNALMNLLLLNGNKVFSLSKKKLKKRKNLKSENCNLKDLDKIKYKLKKLLKVKKIDYVFLNAGILGKIDKINKINFNQINEILRVNVFANKEIIDYLVRNKIYTKLIIAISSGAALSPKYGWYLYCSSKSALKFLIESYAVEHPKRKIISVSPGLIKTKMQDQICKVNEKKIYSVKKFKKLNLSNKVPNAYDVANNILKNLSKINKKSNGSYIDIRKN